MAERAVVIWPNIQRCVNTVLSTTPRSNIPKRQSFQNLREHVLNPLTSAKLQFFISVAKVLQPFLKKYQTDKPMVPFITEDLLFILKAILDKFIREPVIEGATTAVKLINIDIMKIGNILPPKKVDIGFAKKMIVQEVAEKKEASPLQILELQNECIAFLQKLSYKLMERCPLQYLVVRYLVSLDPTYLANKPKSSANKFESLLQQLISHKLKSPSSGDTTLQLYKASTAVQGLCDGSGQVQEKRVLLVQLNR